MKKYTRSPNLMRTILQSALCLVLLAAGLSATRSPAMAAPGPLTGITCAPSCDLYAVQGTMPQSSLPGSPAAGVPIYGFNISGSPATAPGGPVIIVNQDDAVSITLHNVDIPNAASLMINGQPGVPDTAGATAGGTKTYTYAANTLRPGTYLYEAGLTPDGPRQVAMGLYGALIVRPAGLPNQAYASATTAFTDEAVLVLSEIDPAFAANPAGYDMTQFAPKYWLINGKSFPNTDLIPSAAGNTVLLRYVNAGLQHHSMGLLGLHQTVIASDGQPSTNPLRVVAETVPTGGTMDTLVSMPANVPANAQYAVFEAAEHLDNTGSTTGGTINFGGMMTFITASGVTAPSGPVTSAVTASPNPTSGSGGNAPGPVTLSASIDSTSPFTVAEYFVDALGSDGSGCSMDVFSRSSSTAASAVIPISGATAPCVDLTTLSSANHTFYVHGSDGTNWGPVASTVLNLDKTGPASSGLSLSPSLTNGTVNTILQATASDVNSGNQNVVAAEYFIDSQPDSTVRGTAFTFIPATVVSLSDTINTFALSQGSHTLAVRGQDALGNWGDFALITLKIDKTGPAATGVSATPNPNNGLQGIQVSSGGGFYVRIDATITDPANPGTPADAPASNIVAGEYFIDTTRMNGSGGSMLPNDGLFNSPSENVYAAVDLYVINTLTQGQHTIYVHGKDAAGNWGSFTLIPFIIDRTNPTLSALSTNPNPANLAASITLNITAADPANNGSPVNGPGSNIVGGEYFWGTTDPGIGLATAFTMPSPAPSGGFSVVVDVSQRTIFTNNTLSVRVKDAAGNWSNVLTTTISIDRIFANSFPTLASPFGWSGVGGAGANLSLNAGANMLDAGTNSLAASVLAGASGYVINTLPTGVSAYDARFYLNPNSAALGTATPTVFAALANNSTVIAVQLRLSGGSYQVRLAGSSTWVPISNAPTAIEVVRTGSTLRLYVGAGPTASQQVSVSTSSINSARLGLVSGVTNGMNGVTIYLDGFVSSRTTRVGP